MDILVYIVTALITISWSIRLYIMWLERAGLPEESAVRFLLLIAPGSYLFLLAVSGWVQSIFLRLDLLGLVMLDLMTVICAIVLFVSTRSIYRTRRNYLIILTVYNLAAVMIIGLVYAIRLYPPMLIRVSYYLKQLEELNILEMKWVALNPENHEQDVLSLLNKIVIALFSYIPVSMLRILYMSRQRKKLERDMENLERRVADLEKLSVKM